MLLNILSNTSILVHISKLILERLTYNSRSWVPTTQTLRVLNEALVNYNLTGYVQLTASFLK